MWREIAGTVLDWLLLALYALVAVTFALGFTALVFAKDAQAEPVYQQVVRKEMGWRISTYVPAVGRPVPLAVITLLDINQGERIRLDGWAQIDAPAMSEKLKARCQPKHDCSKVGVNFLIAYCDDADPECNFTGRNWPEHSGVTWDAGNISYKVQHHAPMYSTADYVSPFDQPSVTFKLFVNVYGKPGRVAVINDCRITSERISSLAQP